jgi:hypothetical protein
MAFRKTYRAAPYRRAPLRTGRRFIGKKGKGTMAKTTSSVRAGSAGNVNVRLKRLEMGPLHTVELRAVEPATYWVGQRSVGLTQQSYFRLPVTEAVPTANPNREGFSASVFRRSRVVTITGYRTEMEVAFTTSTNISMIMHHVESSQAQQLQLGVDGLPHSFHLDMPDKSKDMRRLMTLEEAGVADDRNSPFVLSAVRSGDADVVQYDYSLMTSNGEMFGCPLAKGRGKSVGSAEVTVDEKLMKRSARRVDIRLEHPNPGTSLAHTAKIAVYWKMFSPVEFLYDESRVPLAAQNMIVTCEVKSKAVPIGAPDDYVAPAGSIVSVLSRLYFHG